MEITNVNAQELIFALDIGTRSIIGTVGVMLNGSKANYYQPLNDGDIIEIYWEKL